MPPIPAMTPEKVSARIHTLADADSAVLGRVGLETNRAQLVPATRAKEIEPDGDRDEQRDDQREIGGGSVECRRQIGEAGKDAGVDLRRVERLRHVQMSGDEPVEQREHDEVEHDRDDHFVRAESRLEIRRAPRRRRHPRSQPR